MAIQFELYKTPRPKDEEDKEVYHARVVNFQHIDTDYLAKEIQIATSLTEGDVKSVLESLSHFMGDRLREGQTYKYTHRFAVIIILRCPAGKFYDCLIQFLCVGIHFG